MLHTIYIIGTILVAPVLCIFIEYCITRPQKNQLVTLCLKWLIFWLGIRSLSAGLMQAINPAYTAELLQVDTQNFLIIQELGFANIGMGTLAVLSIVWPQLQKPVAICSGIFLLGAAFLHIQRIEIIHWGEVMSLLSDLYNIIIFSICIFRKDEYSFGRKEKANFVVSK